ncbi:OmpA family protein [Cellulosimicrobium marinum]|uniref:OmpA family protein n=1 Tax=Cellulosimicrobium marinum TaxID=1638992 RepID=UPI001E5B61FB|nr:OmpA family protein [Cellulosimicrobium marinum]MCB7136691.1 OmpA family protein [Cellulosimicrobium marinum]
MSTPRAPRPGARARGVARSAALAGATLVLAATAPLAPSAVAGADDAGAPLPDDVVAALAQDDARVDAATVTGAMHRDATFTLRPADPTLVLRPDDATTTLESTREDEEGTVVVLTADLLFAFDESTLSPEASAALADLVDDVPDEAAVAVDGHTDALGTDARNDALSRARAESVAAVLRAERPDLTLTVTGHGSREPVAENTVGGEDNPAGRALNRRVELSWGAA